MTGNIEACLSEHQSSRLERLLCESLGDVALNRFEMSIIGRCIFV
jgi:hypothetical protein